MRPGIALLLLLCLGATSSCAAVRPWQRGRLAAPAMQRASDPQRSAFSVHVERNREAMAGATAAGGPSCGCN